MFHAFGRLLHHVITFTAIVAGLMICMMMLQVSIDVIGRYGFNAPLPATIVFVSHYYMLFVVFLPLAVPERTDSHISVEIVTEHFPRAVQRHLRSWLYLVGAAIYLAMARASLLEAMAKYGSSARLIESNLAVLIWPGYFILPVGCGLIALVLAYKFVAYLTGLPSGLDGIASPQDGAKARP